MSDRKSRIDKIIADTKLPAVVRQAARDIRENTYTNTGKWLSDMCPADLATISREWQTCFLRSVQEDRVPLEDQYWFNALCILALTLEFGEQVPEHEQMPVNKLVSLLMSFVAILFASRAGVIECTDVRRMSLSADFFKQDFSSLLRAAPGQDKDLPNAMITAWGVIGSIDEEDHPFSHFKDSDLKDPDLLKRLGKVISETKKDAADPKAPPLPDYSSKGVSLSLLRSGTSAPQVPPPSPGESSIPSLEEKLRRMIGKS